MYRHTGTTTQAAAKRATSAAGEAFVSAKLRHISPCIVRHPMQHLAACKCAGELLVLATKELVML
eukprot:m.169212 g.169212  ORF g.169212 m.169212 type:complete len:65 (-) comp17800_c0_seq5:1555-1749(-)